MSFLAPLYLLGGLAISVPFLLHLIRRTPRGHQVFSSLMFLSPTPPRITRRSRIEHWLLLLLRAALVAILALAFARPFLRESAQLLIDRGPGKQVAILLDTSASMRRGDLWKQALERVERTLTELAPNDVAALYPYDAVLHSTLPFPDVTVGRETQLGLIRARLKELRPSWKETRLDQALITVADALAADRRDRGGDRPCEMVVVSDLQQGALLAGLQGYEWPKEVRAVLSGVRTTAVGNAAARLLPMGAEGEQRVRVASTAGSLGEEFTLQWANATGTLPGEQSAYVPPGQSRVVKLADRPAGADRLRLRGDAADFDNDFFVSPEFQREFVVHYLGGDAASDVRGLRYFLERVWLETPRRKVRIVDFPGAAPEKPAWQVPPGAPVDLVVVAENLDDARHATLRGWLEQGGTALAVTPSAADGNWLTRLIPQLQLRDASAVEPAARTAGKPSSFALLTNLDLQHPLFAPFVEPRFADFSKVRFWRHVVCELPDSPAPPRSIARFDDGSLALWETSLGKGKLLVLASSWRTSDSQLALSSKFVPLVSSVLLYAAGERVEDIRSYAVGSPLPLPPGTDKSVMRTPAGDDVAIPAGLETFTATEEPGIYEWKSADKSVTFAVNIPPAESEIDPIEPTQLEQLGVRLKSEVDPRALAEQQRQMRDLELESRQKLWQWLLLAGMIVLGAETVVARRAMPKNVSGP